MSKVVIVRTRQLERGTQPDREVTMRMFSKGLALLSGQTDLRSAVHVLLEGKGRIGIKINTIGGKKLSTNPETAKPLLPIRY